ncbi:MurR/RpiR family transcriptional regulator [Streptomyces sp. NPDC005953]|uniref:MurR/RpiR family transcriptional regulator n=1 Tax=Streptomyces sp. NPDC005953 TaxID=3156719 RepID=UPI0033FB5B43
MIDDNGADDMDTGAQPPQGTSGGGTVAKWLDGLLTGVSVGPKAAHVREVLTTQPTYCSYATAAEVAARAEVNPATVVRFAQLLGFPGWPQLQAGLRAVYLDQRFDTGHPVGGDGGLLATAFARDAQNLKALEKSFDFETARRVVSAIRDARRTVVVASGTHAIPASALAMVAASRGFPISYEDRGGPQLANELARLGNGDCLVAWSFWQHYRQTVASLRIARTAGATTCVITDTLRSPPAREAEHVLVIPTEGVASIQSMTAATSVAYGLLAELMASDPAGSRTAVRHVSGIWRELDLFADDASEKGV